jgi:hypothetical protein
MRRLHRGRLYDDVLEAPEAALVREALARRPRLQDNFEPLVEARLRLLGRDTEAFEFGMALAFSDPEIEPSTGHEVEGCGLLGEQNWVVPGQHQHGGAEAERRRARGEPSWPQAPMAFRLQPIAR